MAQHTGTLIAGAGEAGLALAVALRERGDEAGITLVGAEPFAPYQRPPLSKDFLSGALDEEGLALRAPGFYGARRIELRTGVRVADAQVDERGRGRAVLSDGTEIGFDRLALTTGARPRRLPVPGAGLAGVRTLRDIADARALREQLARARAVVVVGGGFIGLEAAAVARGRGLPVTVVESLDRLLQRVVAPPVSEFYRQAHIRRGAVVELGAGVVALHDDGTGHVGEVELGDGRRIPADLVVIGIGVVPEVELAERLGLAVDGGIVVDAAGRTSHPGVVAAGDCTAAPHPCLPGERLRLESVQNAVDQAELAAASLLGAPPPSAAVPWFWSNQGDLRLQIAGLSAGYDRYVVRGEPASEHFSVLYFREGRLIAVDAVNAPHDFLAVKRALGRGAGVDPEAAADAATPLKQLISATGARPVLR